MNVAQSRSLDLVVGATLGAAFLGVLRVSVRLIEALYGALAAPISKLWVILVPENTDAGAGRSKIYLEFTTIASLFLLPTFSGLFLVADEMVTVLLDPDYALAADLIKVLCIAGLFAPFVQFRTAAFTAIGRLNRLMVLAAIDVVVVLVSASVLVKYGLVAATYSLVICAAIKLLTNFPVLIKAFGASYIELLHKLYPVYLAISCMAACLIAVDAMATTSSLLVLLVLKIAIGAISFTGYLLTFHRQWLTQTIRIVLPDFNLPFRLRVKDPL